MTTLISAHNSSGCIGRCDAKCYNAEGGDCDCICGGSNHGAGLKQAIENSAERFKDWTDDWKKKHPDTTHVKRRCIQEEMF